MASSSRVFVRGLPPNLTQEEFMKHFSTVAPTTDAKLIPKRRIGYVGYHTPEDANKAVKYFNRSFIRTAKISTELARPAEDRKSHGNDDLRTNHNVQEKKGPERVASIRSNAPTRSPLSAVAPPAKRRVEVDLLDQASGVYAPENIDEAAKRPAGPVLESTAPSPKRIRLENPEEQGGGGDFEVGPGQPGEGSKPSTPTIGYPASHEPLLIPPQTSDTDWIRSRTSRLLDLIDPDEPAASEAPQPADVPVTADKDLHPNEAYEERETTPTTNDEQPIIAGESEEQDELPEATAEAARSEQDMDFKRLFVRNLPYTVSTESLQNSFQQMGRLKEVHIPTDAKGQSKGFAYVTFETHDAAVTALQTLDGRSFEGRLLHVMKASARRDKGLDLDAISHLPPKKQRQIKRKLEASSATFKWNTLYMNPDAVLSSVADRLGVPKSELVDPTSTDAAVKQAHAETNVIQESKTYFATRGVDLNSFKGKERSDTVILAKNFPFGTSREELQKLFEPYGSVKRILMPPSAVIAMVEMDLPGASKMAFKALAYRKFKDTVLFLEKAPKGILDNHPVEESSGNGDSSTGPEYHEDPLETATAAGPTSTLFVKNLNFSTNSAGMAEFFKPLKGFLSARVKTYPSSKKPGEILSTGFGFVEFSSKAEAEAALAAVNGQNLDGHHLVIRVSHRALDAAEERRRQDEAKAAASRRTKVIIKNLPFEATKKDVRALFQPYGKLRSVRVPKKFDRSTRGFGFADFVSTKEAESAMNALQGTHLLGRRLNLEFAAEDLVDPEAEIERMQQKVGKQTESLSLQQMASGPRKKFAVEQQEEIDKF